MNVAGTTISCVLNNQTVGLASFGIVSEEAVQCGAKEQEGCHGSRHQWIANLREHLASEVVKASSAATTNVVILNVFLIYGFDMTIIVLCFLT